MAVATESPRTTPSGDKGFRAPIGNTLRERFTQLVLFVGTCIAIVVLITLFVDILRDGGGRLSWDFITSYSSRFAERTGIRAGLTGSLSLMVLVAVIGFPIGIGAALYLEEFAPRNRWTRLLETNINNLAGVPSIVYGLLGLSVFVGVFGLGRSLIAGALTLVVLVLPVVIVSCREALRAVPREIRSGGLALGATPLQTALRQTLPAAVPATLTGMILSLSRAVGETAPILVAGALVTGRSDTTPWGLTDGYTAIPVQIFDFVKRPQDEFQIEVASAAIIVLMTVLLIMNSAAIIIRNRYARTF